jgi:hypothetical protein
VCSGHARICTIPILHADRSHGAFAVYTTVAGKGLDSLDLCCWACARLAGRLGYLGIPHTRRVHALLLQLYCHMACLFGVISECPTHLLCYHFLGSLFSRKGRWCFLKPTRLYACSIAFLSQWALLGVDQGNSQTEFRSKNGKESLADGELELLAVALPQLRLMEYGNSQSCTNTLEDIRRG